VRGRLCGGSLIKPDDPCERLDLRGLLDEWRSASDADERGDLAASLVDLVLDDGELDPRRCRFRPRADP